MDELQKEMQKATEQQQGVGKPGFDNVLANQVQQTQQTQGVQPVQEVQKATEPTKAADVLKTAQTQSLQGVNPDTGVKVVDKKAEAREAGFKTVLNKVVDGQNKLDEIIKMATSGKTYGNQELLAIQAAVYKFSQELDLTSKVVEKATSGVKQTMQTQV
jgi:hypothetical protein